MYAALISLGVFLGLLEYAFSDKLKIKVISDISELNRNFNSQEVDATIANYGMVPYGKSLIGMLHVATPRNACSPLDSFKIENGADPNPIVIVRRGQCTFVTKTHYAQLIGAKLVIVVDNVQEDENKIIMVDDGHGHDINIPTIMINNELGEKLLKYAEPTNSTVNNLISLSLFFEIPKPDNRVEYDYWMSSFENKSYEFIRSMKSYNEKLGENVLFTPHYALWYCLYCQTYNYNVESENCISGGRYCAPDPDGKDGPLSGRDVVMEDLRELCVYQQGHNKWWDYMLKFQNCINQVHQKKDGFKVDECSYQVISEIGMDKKKIQDCVLDSFGGNQSFNLADNKLLSKERKLFYEEGIQIWPSLIINNMTYRGNFDPPEGVFEAICNGFDVSPPVCNPEVPSSGLSTGSVVAIIIACLSVFMCLMLFIYKRIIRREMAKELQMQVNTAISQYYALNDSRTKK